MAFVVSEWYGHNIDDVSDAAEAARESRFCPFITSNCTKRFSDSTPNGVCAVEVGSTGRIAICPNRMHADSYQFLRDVCDVAFGPGTRIVAPDGARKSASERLVVAFGKRFGGELQLPRRPGQATRGYFVDWILALLNPDGSLAEFVAVELQTIDTTGSYKPAVGALEAGTREPVTAKANLNWENVNKRILPQLIYKGQVLRRERLCKKGLFFVCPTQVYRRMADRLGNDMMTYSNLQTGSVSFIWYDTVNNGGPGQVRLGGSFSTTVDQVALAFTAPRNLPDEGVYELAILRALSKAETNL